MPSPRRRLIAVILLIAPVAVASVVLLLLRPKTHVTYRLKTADGPLLADNRLFGKTLNLLGLRIANSSMVLKTQVWKDGAWHDEQLAEKYRWSLENGYQIILRVPDTKTKIQLFHA